MLSQAFSLTLSGGLLVTSVGHNCVVGVYSFSLVLRSVLPREYEQK